MTLKVCFCRLLAAGLAVLLAPSALAIDSFSYEAGGGDNTQVLRIGLQSLWQKKWLQSNGTHVGGYWDLTLSRWRWASARSATHTDQYLNDLGIMPAARH